MDFSFLFSSSITILISLASFTFLFIAYLRRNNEQSVLQDLLDSERDKAEALSNQLQYAQAELDKLKAASHGRHVRADDCEVGVGSVQDMDDSPLMYKQPEDVGSILPSSYFSFSCSRPGRNYDVFLSFRGEDTRNNFVSHLYKALDRNGIYTFKDDEKLKRGKSISPELLKAVQESRFSIVVLSENYVTSSWCLDELVKILECMDQLGQTVVPIFYKVDPSHLRKQTGSFAKAFDKHEKAFEEREKVLIWREALRRVGSISGCESRDRDESTLIEKIVREILDTLFSESSSADSKLVGMGYHIQQMNFPLCIDSDDVHMLGIWGMGGIGKTTIAKAIYDRFSCQYEGSCFIANVKGNFKRHDPTLLIEKLLSNILLERNLNIRTLDGGFNVIKERLSHKKVFIVLDDVENLDELETLAGMPDWFGPGSKIIITTRDRQLLVMHGVKYIYKVEELKKGEALQLFKQYAFKQNHPTADYLKLSNQFVSYAKGLPLALKVLGSFLYSKSIKVWKSELKKLQKIPKVRIQDVLRISYDGLNDDIQRDMFLDIACFFNGEDKDFVINILESCDLFPDTDLTDLVDKCLVNTWDNKLWMHDLLQQMGWDIVRQESVEEPGKRSRLWDPKDVSHVLKNNMGTEAVKGIFFDTSKIEAVDLSPEAFTRMHNLRLLKVFNSDHYKGFEVNCKVNLPRGLESLPGELRYLYWHRCPLTSLPPNFQPINLVEINMHYSNLERLWEGVEGLTKLKRIELSQSRHLKEIPDLSKAQNLENIILEDCTNLLEVHPSTHGLKSLNNLILSGCSKLKMSPEIPENVKQVRLDGTSIQELHSSFQFSHRLTMLKLNSCKNLVSLPDGFSDLKCLENLTLYGCSNLASLPENFGDLKSLRYLNMSYSGIKLLPFSITRLDKLEDLFCNNCKGEDSTGLLLPPLSGLRSLKLLDLSECNLSEFPEVLSCVSSLKVLNLERNNFESLPASIKHLSSLKYLKLEACKRLRTLPEPPSGIQEIIAHDCTSLEAVSISSCEFMIPRLFRFTNCFKLNQIAGSNAKQIIQVAASKAIPFDRFRTSYPGSELPEWLTHQRMGSKITIQLPSHSLGNFVGVTLGVVVSFEGDNDIGWRALRCKTSLESREKYYKLCEPNTYSFLDVKAVGDHVFLSFEDILDVKRYSGVDYHPKMKAIIRFSCWKVKKCAVVPVYSESSEDGDHRIPIWRKIPNWARFRKIPIRFRFCKKPFRFWFPVAKVKVRNCRFAYKLLRI